MVECTEYAVFRFLDQNGYCHMINDYVKGSSVMQYVKEDVKVSRQQIFKWLAQLAHQLEQYYRCEEEKAYGYVNPYAVIVTEGNTVLLLDTQETENNELLKRMQKKKVRMLFVRREYALSQRTERADDWYGFGKTMEFLLAKCCGEGRAGRREEKILRRIDRKCQKGEHAGVKDWIGLQKDLRLIAEAKKPEKEPGGRMLLAAAAAVVLILAGISVFRPDGGNGKTAEAAAVPEETKEKETGEQTEKEPEKGEGEAIGKQVEMELGLLYFVELEDYEKSMESLEKAAEESPLAADYLEIIRHAWNGETKTYIERGLAQALESGEAELEEKKEEIQGKECLYKLPLLCGYEMLDTREAWQEARRIGEEMESEKEWNNWGKDGNKEKEVRGYLARSYVVLEETEQAIEEYEKLRELENDADELEEIYLRLEELYEETGQAEQAWEVCRASVEEVPESGRIWLNYIRRHCKDAAIERTVCAEEIKKALEAVPELEEAEEFEELKEEYEITVDGETVTVGK